ncbi:hypothetical protein DOTSEDRAFT_33397 [Dothistroma septosporum NZE10]|uniref:Uncharacterized protein n=1 Tax=Dothistroma septosporum (strain NZE10 / CBS 128990) TaxID=675120 RepID=N1PWS4_DOTSN|nr:hypothetical protein DOTSEDRAFT_33397 [Dothistroma septosporum NZE10]
MIYQTPLFNLHPSTSVTNTELVLDMGKNTTKPSANARNHSKTDDITSAQQAKNERNLAKFPMTPGEIVKNWMGRSGCLRDYLTGDTVMSRDIVHNRVGSLDVSFNLSTEQGALRVDGVNLGDHRREKLEEK